jgi:hypothetical protein
METCRSCNQFLIVCLCPPGGHPPSKNERTVRAEDSKRKVKAAMRKKSCPFEETKLYPKEDEKEKELPISIVSDERSPMKKEEVTVEERKVKEHVVQMRQEEETKNLAVYSKEFEVNKIKQLNYIVQFYNVLYGRFFSNFQLYFLLPVPVYPLNPLPLLFALHSDISLVREHNTVKNRTRKMTQHSQILYL